MLHDGSLVERLEIAVEIHGVVAGGEGGCQLSLGGCILHNQVDRTTNAITLLVGCQRLGHLQAIQHFRGEDVEGHKTVLVVRAGNLHPINKGVIIPFIHTAEDGVLSLATAVALHGHTRHTLNDVGYRNIR